MSSAAQSAQPDSRTPERIEPGRFHRFPGVGKRNGNKAGWCKLFDDGRGGVFGDFVTGAVESWQAEQPPTQTPAEREAFRRNVEKAKARAEAKRNAEHAEARKRASAIWDAGQPAHTGHPYLTAKGVKPHGIRQHGDDLVIPMRDGVELHSLQSIAPNGEKRSLAAGRVHGCYYSIGNPDGTLCIAEGFATGASIHEATGYAVAVAFSAGNLEPVAVALRTKLSEVRIIICADDDYGTDGNPGIRAATRAALAVGGLLVVPDFGADRPEGATDFNDLAVHRGREAVERAIANARPPQVSAHQPATPNATAADSDGPRVRLIRGDTIETGGGALDMGRLAGSRKVSRPGWPPWHRKDYRCAGTGRDDHKRRTLARQVATQSRATC